VTPDIDNMLKISSDGRHAALDTRLVGLPMPAGESKTEAVADQVAQRWEATRANTYLDVDGQPHPTPGALQLVFCDLSTPSTEKWNVYDELRSQLYARGLPAGSVRFIHEPRNDREKAQLFEECRTGQVSVLIGSTGKMGVGTNVQARAVALHHMDCPWRPADIRQRDGRIERQGNQNPEIEILRYVTEGSFDAYSWQTVARKAAFIDQLMKGRLDQREIEDIGSTSLSFNEVKALAAGNPLLMDKARADAEVNRLERLERGHHSGRSRLRHEVREHAAQIEGLTSDIDTLRAAIADRRDTRGDRFRIVVEGLTFTDRTEAGHALHARIASSLDRSTERRVTVPDVVALGGHRFDLVTGRSFKHGLGYELLISGVPAPAVDGTPDSLSDARPSSLIVRLENALDSFERSLARSERNVTYAREQLVLAEQQLQAPFKYAEGLEAARSNVAVIDKQLAELARASEEALTEAAAAQAAQEGQQGPDARTGPDSAGVDPTQRPGTASSTDTVQPGPRAHHPPGPQSPMASALDALRPSAGPTTVRRSTPPTGPDGGRSGPIAGNAARPDTPGRPIERRR
jgi:hypothetical protein